ncbi:cysteine--tRNA ligase [Patescibacteria group bacterium]|nr:cysteine--tRNA ligase [Patescibacteria group bacterium]MBU2220477.1 cysteine--tRNA ligase [Patescibacteria group bacterium]
MSWFPKLFTRVAKPITSDAPLFFTNTLSGKKDLFSPLTAGQATMYSCGPTVYSKAQIGNLRAYVFSDLIARVLSESGYRVRRVINITDVGHLQGDGDEGEDKIEAGAKKEGLHAEAIASKYTKLFIEDLSLLNIDTNAIQFPRATEYIKEQIAIITLLEEKGLTYRTADGIYFDTEKYPNYGVLDHSGPKLREEAFAEIGRRIKTNKEKHSPADFALWKFSPLGVRRQQEWSSPWGVGFPGWHIECSAMARALLGQPIDIHTGGMDHIPVHHTNEIAQSECAFGKPLARFWMHQAFLTLSGEKISKSLGNDVYLSNIVKESYSPLSLRYFFLQAHYRSPLSFSWEALAAANEALERLTRLSRRIAEEAKYKATPSDTSRRVIALLRDDLATPAALALLWEAVRDEDMERSEQLGVIKAADAVLGLSLLTPSVKLIVPESIQRLIEKREEARENRDFSTADALRIHISNSGYHVEDGPSGPIVTSRPG